MDERTITSENLDDLEVSLIVLAKDARAVAQSATFMSKRGWPTLVFQDVGKAIAEISKKPPDFVLLSLNHPSPKILKLPALLLQAFNIPSIMFVEMSDAPSVLSLQASPEKYKLSGSSSGPSMQRYIRKLLIELYGIAPPEKESNTEHGTDDKSGTVRVMGQEGNDGKNILVEGQRSEGRKSLAALKKTGPLSGDKINSASEIRQQLLALASSGDGVASTPEQMLGNLSGMLSTAASTQNGLGGSFGPTNPSSQRADTGSQQNGIPYMPSQGGSEAQQTPTGPSSPMPSMTGSTMTGASPQGSVGNAMPGLGSNVPTAAHAERMGLLKDFMKQMIVDCKNAFDAINVQVDSVSRELCVIAVDSPEIHGYAVFALPVPSKDRVQFAKQVAAVMPKTIGAGALALSIPLIIPFLQKSFADLATYASFIEVIDAGKLAGFQIAFFQTEQRLPSPHRNSDNMSRIPIREISPEIPVNFETYLQMTRNNKYLLYLRTGRKLMQRQQMSLLENDILEFHISEKEETKFKAYMAYGFFFQLSKPNTSSHSSAA
jgi:hypothetical protein